MSDKLTIKQGGFCKTYVETSNASEAYRVNYNAENMSDKAIGIEACRLLKRPNVALEVNRLKEKHQKRHETTVDSLVNELEEARGIAKETGQPSSMVSATMGKGKLLGLVTDKSQISADPENPLVVILPQKE